MKSNRKPNGYWTKTKCYKNALLYKTINTWRIKSGSAYGAAWKNKWLEVCCKHMLVYKRHKGFWNKERCLKEALKYKHKSEFKKNSGSAYNSAAKNNWLHECCKHMKPIGNRHVRLIYVILFHSKRAYVGLTGNPNKRFNNHLKDKKGIVYRYIKENKINKKHIKFIKLTDFINQNEAIEKEEMFKQKYEKEGYFILNKAKTGGLGGNIKKWTKDNCKKEALKYSSKTEFQKKCASAYQASYKNCWLTEICSHMKKPNYKPDGYWNNDKNIKNIYNAARDCYSITNFSKKYVTANRVLNLPKNINHKRKIYLEMGWKIREK